MAILVKTKTPEQDKDFWATSWKAFRDAEWLYGRSFKLDVAAEAKTAKCKRYYVRPGDEDIEAAGMDALTSEWGDDWWCNPPFTEKAAFICAARNAQADGHSGMMLLPYEPLAKWWRELLADEVIIYEPDGRYQFLERDGETMKQGANFGSALVLFPAHKIGQSVRVPFKRGVSEV
ncbi:MAG: DNA N-6-adenine-methyltransferase [Aeromonadaceae bacterium]